MSLSENLQQPQSEPGDPSARPSTPPSASGTVAADSNLEKSIQEACEPFGRIFLREDEDNWVKKSLAWFAVGGAISRAEGSNQKERLRNKSEFMDYVMPGSHGERELIKLLKSTMKQEVPWRDLFENGTLLSPL